MVNLIETKPKSSYSFTKLVCLVFVNFVFFSSCLTVSDSASVCPVNTVLVASKSKNVSICVDRFEASPTSSNIDDSFPVSNMNYYQCKHFCEKQNKRLLKNGEWRVACEGTKEQHCNRNQTHPIIKLLKSKERWFYKGLNCKDPANTWGKYMQDPRINMQKYALGKNSSFDKCVSKHGVHNMVGNLGEWVEGQRRKKGQLYGRFNGGLYPQKSSSCSYTTVAHTLEYKDYSIGCRCAFDL